MPIFRRHGGSRGGGKIRLLLALIIAGVGLFTYYMNTQKNPITGEEQRVGNITPAQEVAMGYNTMPQLVQQMGGKVPDDDPRAQLVVDVGKRLLQNARLTDTPYEFTFTLLDDPETVNAFALPGGPVFITRALFEQMENEAQLAGVLGHEIGHVVHRHSAEKMAQANLGQMMTLAVGVGASGDDYRSGQMAAAAAAMAAQVIMQKYSRGDELESDDQGLSYMTNAGYDPREMIKVMEILKKATGETARGPNFMASHPDPDARMQAIEKWVKENYPNGVPESLRKGMELN